PVTSFDATFGINLRFVVAAQRLDLYQLSVQLRDPIVRRANLIERELKLGHAFHFTRPPHLRDVAVDDVAGVLGRLDYTRLNTIATLTCVSGNRREQFDRENRIARNGQRTVAGYRSVLIPNGLIVS